MSVAGRLMQECYLYGIGLSLSLKDECIVMRGGDRVARNRLAHEATECFTDLLRLLVMWNTATRPEKPH